MDAFNEIQKNLPVPHEAVKKQGQQGGEFISAQLEQATDNELLVRNELVPKLSELQELAPVLFEVTNLYERNFYRFIERANYAPYTKNKNHFFVFNLAQYMTGPVIVKYYGDIRQKYWVTENINVSPRGELFVSTWKKNNSRRSHLSGTYSQSKISPEGLVNEIVTNEHAVSVEHMIHTTDLSLEMMKYHINENVKTQEELVTFSEDF